MKQVHLDDATVNRYGLQMASIGLVISLLLTMVAIVGQGKYNAGVVTNSLRNDSKLVVKNLADHFSTYRFTLIGLRGSLLTKSTERLDPEVLDQYVKTRNTYKEFPGMVAKGLVLRQTTAGVTRYPVAYAAFMVPGFEKFADLDLAALPGTKEAADHALAFNESALSIHLPLGSKSEMTKILLVPVFKPGLILNTTADREKAFMGWVASAVDMTQVFTDANRIMADTVELSVTDVASGDHVLASPGFASANQEYGDISVEMPMFQRTWIMTTRPTQKYVEHLNLVSPRLLGTLVLLVGLVVSGLMFVVGRNVQRSRLSVQAARRMEALVNSAGDAIVSLNTDLRIVSWNKGAYELFGYREEDVLDRGVDEILVPTDRLEENEWQLTRARDGVSTPSVNTVRRHRDRRLIDVAITVSPVFDDRREVIGVSLSFKDQTEMMHNQQLFQAAISAAPSAMIMVNSQRHIVLVNPKAASLFGYEADELMGQPLDKLVPLRFHGHHGDKVQGYMNEPKTRNMGFEGKTLYAVTKSGKEIPVEVGLNPMRMGEDLLVLASIVDVSVRKKLESELQLTLDRMQMAVSASGLGIWVWNLRENTLVWDQRMRDIYGVPFGTSDEDINYALWRSRVHPEDVDATEQMLNHLVDGLSDYDPTFRIVLPSGEVRYVQAGALVERDERGDPLRVVGINTDVTEATEAHRQILAAKQEADQANQFKSDFLANMSHEIRTPMNGILGLSYLLQKQALPPSAQDMVHKIRAAGQGLLGIINDILDFSKIEANRLDIEDVPFRLSDVLDHLANIMSAAATEKTIEVVVSGPKHPDSEFLRGDALRLGQVLINLATNAIKFTERGEVVLSVSRLGETPEGDQQLRFSVRDSGIGISPDKVERIFDAFAQADTSTTRTHGGTGLGLSISRLLVEKMGGQLKVASIVGLGSEFHFDLTLPRSEGRHAEKLSLQHQRVLIVEDNETARVVMQDIVASLGWHAQTVGTGEEALRLMATRDLSEFDLLLVDWRMPGMNGLETLVRLQDTHANQTMPNVVMVTAFDREQLAKDERCHMADVLLSKPVTTSSLFNAVVEAKHKHGQLPNLPAPAATAQRLNGVRLLVVDDSSVNREVAHDILSDEGAHVTLACDGAEAVSTLINAPSAFDLVLMDVQMPVMDGYEATRQIRSTDALRHLPVIALTAGALKEQQRKANELGMNDFVPKPFDVDVLVNAILKWRLTPQGAVVPPAPPVVEDECAPNATALREVDCLSRADVLIAPLLDESEAYKRWRKPESFWRSLRSFARDHAQDAERYEALLLNGDLQGAESMAHKLKGAAGALSLTRLQRLAHCFEVRDELLAHDPNLAVHGTLQITTLDECLRATLAAIQTHLAEHDPTEPPSEPSGDVAVAPAVLTPKAVAELMQQLHDALQSFDPEAVEPLLPQVASAWGEPAQRQLQACLDSFDFSAGLALLNVWKTGASQPPKEN